MQKQPSLCVTRLGWATNTTHFPRGRIKKEYKKRDEKKRRIAPPLRYKPDRKKKVGCCVILAPHTLTSRTKEYIRKWRLEQVIFSLPLSPLPSPMIYTPQIDQKGDWSTSFPLSSTSSPSLPSLPSPFPLPLSPTPSLTPTPPEKRRLPVKVTVQCSITFM